MALGAFQSVPAHFGVARAGMDHDRQPPLLGQLKDVIEPGVHELEALAARMQLEADRAGVQAAPRLLDRAVGGIQAAQRLEPSRMRLNELEHARVRLGIAARLAEREDERPRIDLLERVERLFLGRQQPGRIVKAEVHVGVVRTEIVDVPM